MSGTSLPWSAPTGSSPSLNDSADVLRQIERNTAQTLQWVKYLVYLIAILLIVNVLFLVV